MSKWHTSVVNTLFAATANAAASFELRPYNVPIDEALLCDAVQTGVVAWIMSRAKDLFVSRSQEALAVWRTELGRAVFNMRLSTATPTAASVRWPAQAACAQARANDGLEATHRRLPE